MGGTVSYINADGTTTDTDKFTTATNMDEPLGTGPTTYAGVADVIQNLKDNKIPPFLVVHHTEAANTTTHLNIDGLMPQVWSAPNKIGFPWSVRKVASGISLRIPNPSGNGTITGSRDYICVGHTASLEVAVPQHPSYTPNLRPYKWLFAHKSICYDFPAQTIMTVKAFPIPSDRSIYNANVASAPGDLPNLYQPLGFFGETKNNTCVAVLRAFLKPGAWPGYQLGIVLPNLPLTTPPDYLYNQCSRSSLSFVNTLALSGNKTLSVNYEVVVDVDEVLNNLIGSVLQKLTDTYSIYQGFLIPETKTRHELRSSDFMRGYCNSKLESTVYPEVCSCLGRAGVEAALRTELGNDKIRMVCYSNACIDGQKTGNVYTFTPSPPCAPINICKPGVDVTAAKVSMTNVTFNCDNKSTTVPGSAADAPGSAAEAAAGAQTGGANTGGANTGGADNTGLIVGAAVGGVVFVVIVIAVTVIVVRKMKTQDSIKK